MTGLTEGSMEGSMGGPVEGSIVDSMEGSMEGSIEGSTGGPVEGSMVGSMEASMEGSHPFMASSSSTPYPGSYPARIRHKLLTASQTCRMLLRSNFRRRLLCGHPTAQCTGHSLFSHWHRKLLELVGHRPMGMREERLRDRRQRGQGGTSDAWSAACATLLRWEQGGLCLNSVAPAICASLNPSRHLRPSLLERFLLGRLAVVRLPFR